MSPKKFTQGGIAVGIFSLMALPVLAIAGSSIWWGIGGLALSLGLFVAAFAWGAILSAQHRADMVDMLNDCYTGVNAEEKA